LDLRAEAMTTGQFVELAGMLVSKEEAGAVGE
jgi:hypothetical protein